MALAAALLMIGSAPPADRARPETPTGRTSYSLGHQIGRDLSSQGAAIDTEALRMGLLDGLSGALPQMEAREMAGLLAELKRRVTAAERATKRQESNRRLESGREFLERNKSRPGVVVRESGLQYEVIRDGSGSSPGAGDKVVLHYRGTTMDGKLFHDSRVRPGEPEILHVSGVVRGLTEALQLMKPGALWRLFVPPELAYGRRGPLKNHAVIFEVELISVAPAEVPGE
jgi:FKBP-type peptidyl-prolyl cis-trans isomerase